MFQKILLPLLVCLPSLTFASELPFTDVFSQSSYYADLKHMYDAGVISDTTDHLFHPDGLLPRDEFVTIAVGVSCRKCIYPSPEDIVHYNQDPFIDIPKKNQYFYCISYAKEKDIVRGYILDETGKTQCQNRQSFSEVPFCPANSITRIEAAAVLLRQAGLWNEDMNSGSYEKKMTFSDVDAYWYGYAQKAIESGLIRTGSEGKVSPNEYITRKEFVTMASKIFTINMCSIKNNNNTSANFPSVIKIFDKDKEHCSESEKTTPFQSNTETTYDFGWYATGSIATPVRYDWIFSNSTTGEQKTASGSCLDNFNLESIGSWIAKLVVTDTQGRTSTAYQQVSVNNGGLSAYINSSRDMLHTAASALHGTANIPMSFFSTTTGGDGHYGYHWDFSDGGTASEKDPTHIFLRAGVYPVVLTVRDTLGNRAYAQLSVVISPNLDRDGDGVLDYDNLGNILDVCPAVFGPASNKGCPSVNEYDSGRMIGDNIKNLCLANKVKESGMIEWGVQCTSCPCEYSSEFVAQLRSCDIIFPSITSPDKKTLYSRGAIFSVQ